MRIHLLLSTSMIALGLVTAAVSQEIELGRDNDATRVGPSYASDDAGRYTDYGAPSRSHDCEDDCQVDWREYRNGCLWENYCVEKAWRLDRLARYSTRYAEGTCVEDDCVDCYAEAGPRTARLQTLQQRVRSWRRSLHARHSRLRQERLANFYLFFDLLGWEQCSCCSPSCCDQAPCSADASLQPEIPGPIATAGEDDQPASANSVLADSPSEKTRDDETGQFGGESRGNPPLGSNEDSVSGKQESAAPQRPPQPELPQPELQQPELPQLEPSVPRNKLPRNTQHKAKPTSSRPGAARVLVAERLSDYIKI